MLAGGYDWLAIALLWLTTAQLQPSVHFDSEIIPILTKSGCNSGACHGAAAGRGQLHLSLWGADPAADHMALVHAFEGRRVNLARPELSLLITKPTAQLDHGGEQVLAPDGPGAERLLTWIRSGAKRDPPRELLSFEVVPQRKLVPQLSEQVHLQAWARFHGGIPEDVTAWTLFTSADPTAVEVSSEGIATFHRRGDHVITARFLDRVVPVQLTVPWNDQPCDYSQQPRENPIDELVYQRLEELRLPISSPAAPEELLRRVTLDLTGRLPTETELNEYLTQNNSNRYEKLVDELLSSDPFVDYWTLKLARLLRLHTLAHEPEAAVTYAAWLREQIARDTSWDRIARELLTATGDSHAVGPANFGRMVQDARDQAELVGEVFAGVQLGCANCHNHPLDRWTQDDYHGLAAIFAKLDRGREVKLRARGAVTNLRTGEPAAPRIPGVTTLSVDGDHRSAVADWVLAAPDHLFARATVNRLWHDLFGRGLIDPTHDLRETNPATHPELLEYLTTDFVEHGYRIRHTLKQMVLSHTYRRSSRPVPGNEIDDRLYARAYRRALGPEVLADALADVTGVPLELPGNPPPHRAVQLVDPLQASAELDVLGRCRRAGSCSTSAISAMSLATQLHLLNGKLLNARLAAPHGHLAKWAESGDAATLVRTVFRQAYTRDPSPPEMEFWMEQLRTADRLEWQERAEDLVWSLLNSRDFRENH